SQPHGGRLKEPGKWDAARTCSRDGCATSPGDFVAGPDPIKLEQAGSSEIRVDKGGGTGGRGCPIRRIGPRNTGTRVRSIADPLRCLDGRVVAGVSFEQPTA